MSHDMLYLLAYHCMSKDTVSREIHGNSRSLTFLVTYSSTKSREPNANPAALISDL